MNFGLSIFWRGKYIGSTLTDQFRLPSWQSNSVKWLRTWNMRTYRHLYYAFTSHISCKERLILDRVPLDWRVTKEWESLCRNKEVGEAGDFNCCPQKEKQAESEARSCFPWVTVTLLDPCSRALNSFRALIRGESITAHAINRHLGAGFLFVYWNILNRETSSYWMYEYFNFVKDPVSQKRITLPTD
jgi:hypothetical protein